MELEPEADSEVDVEAKDEVGMLVLFVDKPDGFEEGWSFNRGPKVAEKARGPILTCLDRGFREVLVVVIDL